MDEQPLRFPLDPPLPEVDPSEYYYHRNQMAPWPVPFDPAMPQVTDEHTLASHQPQHTQHIGASPPAPISIPQAGFHFSNAHSHLQHEVSTSTDWPFSAPSAAPTSLVTGNGMHPNAAHHHHQHQHHFTHHLAPHQLQHPANVDFVGHSNLAVQPGHNLTLQPSPMDLATTAGANILHYPTAMDSYGPLACYQEDLQHDLAGYPINQGFQQPNFSSAALLSNSPTDSITLEVQSASGSESGWQLIDFPQGHAVSNPGLTLHIRTCSDSSYTQNPSSAESVNSFGSYEEIQLHSQSPHSDHAIDIIPHPQAISGGTPPQGSPSSPSSLSTSPTSPSSTSPTSRRKKDPAASKSTAKVVKKPSSPPGKKNPNGEKRVGRRKGPLRPEQRISAGEIRKLRACLRCKFLKKTCDKGDPCAGCQPSHARLWQVPCTRIDIKDIAYFTKDWKADYDRHVTVGFSVANIMGFATKETQIYITHGFGFVIPVYAREVFVRDDENFCVDWVESIHEDPREFEHPTARMAVGATGISVAAINEYLDKHLDNNFEYFVDNHFEGTPFLSEMLKTAFNFWRRSQIPVIRKALKLILAYNLTLHLTMVEGPIFEGDSSIPGRIDNPRSKFHGKIVAPVMINFQIKHALAMMWRDLQKEVLEELSTLYSSVYAGEKLKNWPTIFMLATILLAVWEEMQFDSHYRMPDSDTVKKFCEDMESTPVGVIVGLFSAISQKLPGFAEWDTRKHHQVFNSNEAVCDALSETRDHILKYGDYLKSRSDATFDRDDFDCLSNKLTSKLVIRAN